MASWYPAAVVWHAVPNAFCRLLAAGGQPDHPHLADQ
jgi:hypothetical protein